MPDQNNDVELQPTAAQDKIAGQNGSLVSAQWQGPLPPPGALKQFDQIIPNGAERIMMMCEKEQAARIANESRLTWSEIIIEGGGRLVGALLILACLAAAIWSVNVQADWRVTLGFISVPVMGALAKLFERQ
jgi:uncharacterized membrane protein